MKRLNGLLPVYLLILIMLAISWRKWCEPIVDFGRELYVPWQLSLGKSLYADVAYFNGPLSPYFNSFLFRIFGDSLLTLAIANAVLLGVFLTLVHKVMGKLADRTIATITCLCLVPMMCIAQPGPMGNYNFITPYSHEMTHGLLLSFLAIHLLMKIKPGWDLLAGFCAGLTILTKPEIAIACCGAVLAGAMLVRRPSAVLRLVSMMLIPPALAAIVFHGNAFVAFTHLFDTRLTALPFYRMTMGTYDVGTSLLNILIWSAVWIAFLVIGERVAAKCDRGVQIILLTGLIVLVALANDLAFIMWRSGLIVLSVLASQLASINWRLAPLPLILLNAWAVWQAYRSRDPHCFEFCIFATLLLGKIGLNVTLSNYGFALALPAVCVMMCFLTSWKDGLLLREPHGLRCSAIAMLCIGTALIVSLSIRQWRQKTYPIGTGADQFFTSADRKGAADTLDVMKSLPSNATVAVVPQGAMLNYLSRRENSTGFIVIMPPEVLMFGEEEMTAAFTKRPPEYVLVVKSNLSEYGYRSFTGYAPQLAAIIDAGYETKSEGDGWTLLTKRR